MSRGENMLPWREHTDDPPSLDSLVLHFCSVSPWTSHCKRGQFAVSVIYRMPQSICWTKIACKHVCLCLLCPCIVGPFRAVSCAPRFLSRTWSVWPHECRTERRRRLHPRWCCCKWSSSDWWRGGATRGHGSRHHGAVWCCHPGNQEESDR